MKPTIIIKQTEYVTTVALKGVPFAYIITTTDKIKKVGIVGAIKERINDCKAKGYKYATANYETLLQALGV